MEFTSKDFLLGGMYKVRVGVPDGQLFVGGISSSYLMEYPEDIPIDDVVSEVELKRVIKSFNDSIQSFWPCSPCYLFGCFLAPFTLGVSLCVPNYCISEAEKAGRRCLEQHSLKASFYDRKIKVELIKTWNCNSYIELSFPIELLQQQGTLESGEQKKEVETELDIITMAPGVGDSVSSASGTFRLKAS
jgi:hypothetical protein